MNYPLFLTRRLLKLPVPGSKTTQWLIFSTSCLLGKQEVINENRRTNLPCPFQIHSPSIRKAMYSVINTPLSDSANIHICRQSHHGVKKYGVNYFKRQIKIQMTKSLCRRPRIEKAGIPPPGEARYSGFTGKDLH